MPIKRTSKKYQKKWLHENNNLKILDLGCTHVNYWPEANHFADIVDYSREFKEKNLTFTKIYPNQKLPFKNKEFDYVIASHVIEHTEDFEFFIKELERISSKGYIELPTRLGDNLVFENKKDHIWWFIFDDINEKIICSKKNQLIEPFITVSMIKIFEKIFRESVVLELSWEEKIEYKIDNSIRNEESKNISFLKILRKYVSKKIRSFLR